MPERLRVPQREIPSCPAKAPVSERALISMEEAHRIEALFKILANATRLRLLHVLVRNSELPVTEHRNEAPSRL